MRQQRVWMPLPQVAAADAREAAHEYLSFPEQRKTFPNSAQRVKGRCRLQGAPGANVPPG